MKKLLFAIMTVSLLAVASCTKDTLPSTTTPAINGWTFKGNTWYTFISKFHGDTLTAVSDTTQGGYNGVSFIFPSVPTTNGTYRVINYASIPTAGQVSIFYTVYGFPSIFRSIGNDSVNATVTVASGKVSIAVPTVNLLSSTTAIDTSVLTATVTQVY